MIRWWRIRSCPGRGWHKPTGYQLDTARKLWGDLEQVLAMPAANTTTRAYGEAVQPEIDTANARIVSHHMLDPQARSDCWPLIAAQVKNYAAGRGW